MNQQLTITYPCGCTWMVQATMDVFPRNCPDHWPADQMIKIDPKTTNKEEP
jgi:hypothetical protein